MTTPPTKLTADVACGTISHEEAASIALKFINQHFNNPGKERPHASIPADPNRDDDLRLMAYIRQQSARDESAPAAAAIDGWRRRKTHLIDELVSGTRDLHDALKKANARIAELEAKPAQTEETEMVYTPVLDKEYCGSNCTQEAFDKYRQKYAEWRCWPATVVKGAKE